MEASLTTLQKFVVRRVRRTHRELGVGAHGSVEELEADGTTYAGKRIHDALVEFEDNLVSQRFVSECQLMSELRHPHVVQFIGVCFFVGSRFPILVMEYLPANLDHLLEATPKIPLFLKRSILHDVALGLAYLHGRDPPIIHRDLTARNVLLNSDTRAKIADFGVARILDLQPRSRITMTQAPGNFTYMPPEALSTKPTYDVKLDIFSFGHLALFTITQVFPNLLPPTYTSHEEPGQIIGRSETERRVHEMELLHQQLGGQHPFVQLVIACLRNRAELRPSVQQILEQLELIRGSVADPYSHLTRLQLIQAMNHKENEVADLQKALKSKEAELRAQEAKVAHYQQANSQLRLQISEHVHPNSMKSKEVEHDGVNVPDLSDIHLDPEDMEKTGRKSEVDSSDGESSNETSSKESDGRIQPEKVKKPPRAKALTSSPNLEVHRWNGRELTVKCSDIAKEKADIIVVCNNEYLADDGGGVYGAVNRKSGGTLVEKCRKYISTFGPLKVGQIAVTGAGGRLRCKWVIHAVGPDCSYSPDVCKALLSRAIRETLAEAERLKAASIAIPAISTGLFSVSADFTAEAIIDTILGYQFSKNSTLLDIRIVIIGRQTYSCFAKHLVQKSAEDPTFVK